MTTDTAPSVQLDEFGALAVEKVKALAKDYNGKVEVVQAAEGDSQLLLENLRENSTDPEVQAITAKIEKLDNVRFELDQQRDAILKVEVERIKAEAGSGVEAIKAQLDDIRAAFNAARTYLKSTYGEEAVADLPTLVRKSGGKGGASGGTGKRRIRHRAWVVDGKTYDNTGQAAAALKISTDALQAAFFGAAGSDKPEDWNEVVEFPVTVNGSEHTVVSRSVAPAEKPSVVAEVENDEENDEEVSTEA